MPRSKSVRVLSVALLVIAGGFEPVWEIGHAVQHYFEGHHQETAPASKPAADLAAVSSSAHGGHGHLVLQAVTRPGPISPAAVVALPVQDVSLPPEMPPGRGPRFLTIEARAGPGFQVLPPTRGPPLL